MIKTGYISFISQSGGGYDVNGNPISPTISQSDYIDCNLKVVTKEYKTFIDGQYKQAAYSVYVDSSKLTGITISKSVQLQDNNANDLGVFQIQNTEYLNLSKRIKIVV